MPYSWLDEAILKRKEGEVKKDQLAKPDLAKDKKLTSVYRSHLELNKTLGPTELGPFGTNGKNISSTDIALRSLSRNSYKYNTPHRQLNNVFKTVSRDILYTKK